MAYVNVHGVNGYYESSQASGWVGLVEQGSTIQLSRPQPEVRVA